MNRRILMLAVGFVTVVWCAPVRSEGMSREQGDAMISELRQIRQLLEKQQRPEPAPVPAEQPERVRLKLGREFSMGRSDAPIVMVEYTDYQCPFCNRFYTTTFPELKKQYIDTGAVRFITRDYPLNFHPHAMKAAQAAHCAGEQERFWQMKDLLMVNSARLTPETITSLAREASLDMARFTSCMDSGKYLSDIKDAVAAANAVGINGTPSFVVGTVTGDQLDGYRIVGAHPVAEFEKVIKKLRQGVEKQ